MVESEFGHFTTLPNSPMEYICMKLVVSITPTTSKGNKGTDIGLNYLQIGF